jgi:hypothetical protein
VNSVPLSLQPVSPRGSSIPFLVILLLGTAQYYWIKFFYGSISSNIARDLESYQGSIDGLGGETFEWDLFSLESITHRTSVYGEYLASIVFQITGALGGTAVELHAATITTLTFTCIYLQSNRKINSSLVILLTLACPFLFANLLLGNTRQLWGCILIILFYGRTPIFEYFSKNNLSWIGLSARIAIFSILILGVHIGSILIFSIILIMDCIFAVFRIQKTLRQGALIKHAGKPFLLAAIVVSSYVMQGQADELLGIRSKFEFYSSEKDLHSYPYLTGGFFYLVIIPISIDIFCYIKGNLSNRPLRFAAICIWGLIFMSWLLPISHALDRVLTSLVLFVYVKRVGVGSLKNEYIYTSIRLLSAVYYIIFR